MLHRAKDTRYTTLVFFCVYTTMSNTINFEQERNKREQSEVSLEYESRDSQADIAPKKEYAIRETHFENGSRALELLDGQLLEFDYVDTRAIIASHEAVNKDREMRGAKEVHEHITADAYSEAHEVASAHIDETARQAIDLLRDTPHGDTETNDVFARTMRQFTTNHGSNSLLRLRSIPNWSWAEKNQAELATSIKSGLAFAIPKELASDMLATLQEQSSFGMTNSNERTKQTLITGQPRGGDGPEDLYMSIPVTLGDGEVVQLYFLFAATEASESNKSEETQEQTAPEAFSDHSSTVDRLAA